jgi:hypothetical protein
MRFVTVFSYTVATLIASTPLSAFADDPCAAFKWDVTQERALFAKAVAPSPAGKDRASAPTATPNRLYQLELLPVSQVVFAAGPGKSSPPEAFAGILTLNISASGKYRIAIDAPLWIDIVADGKLIAPSDYEGQHGCAAPRKIVEFKLDASQRLILQVSGAIERVARLTIVPAG